MRKRGLWHWKIRQILQCRYSVNTVPFLIAFYRKTKNIFSRKNENETGGTVNGIESGTVNISLNNNEQAVYGLLGKNPYYTRQELADATSKSLRTIQRTLDSLRKKDLLKRIGSDKSGYWEVKNLD